jgi:hypothetical protein
MPLPAGRLSAARLSWTELVDDEAGMSFDRCSCCETNDAVAEFDTLAARGKFQ